MSRIIGMYKGWLLERRSQKFLKSRLEYLTNKDLI